MTSVCEVDNCQLIARVKTRHVDSDKRLLCVMHWRAARLSVPAELQTAHLTALPACFVDRCERDVVTIVGRYDEHPRPVCQRHLDDLNWVDLPQELLNRNRRHRGRATTARQG